MHAFHPATHSATSVNRVLQALVLTFSGISGRLKSIYNKLSNISASVDNNLMWWKASNDSEQPSGAYIFNPKGIDPHEISPLSVVSTSVVKVTVEFESRFEFEI